MSLRNKVLWSEGLFLQPQHFQQQDRYLERYVESRCRALTNHSWGFTELQLDADQLAIGSVAITRARGVLPDGTPFDIPDHDRPPPALPLDESIRDTHIYLALPVRHESEAEFSTAEGDEGLARFVAREVSARDVSDQGQTSTDLRVGTLRTKLMLGREALSDYVALGIAELVEVRPDRSVIVTQSYVPPLLNTQASVVLASFVNELKGLLHHRGEALAGRVAGSGQGGAAEIADFLMLQSVNRYEPVIAHLAELNDLHPEALYRTLLEIAGDLTTFSSASRRPPAFNAYRHDALAQTFEPVMNALREALGTVIEQRAVPIPLSEPRYGLRAGVIKDRTLLSTAEFVLAVRADMPAEELRRLFPPQTKIGSVEGIKALVEAGVPGVPVQPLPVAPRQLPYHADYVYFRLERVSDYWPDLQNSGGFGIYVGGDFPGLDMAFWAIRG